MHQLTLFPDLEAPPDGFVYYGTDGSRIKIGHTHGPLRRRGGELGITILHHETGGTWAERQHQRRWRAYRIGTSEWFFPADPLLLWLVVELTGRGMTTNLRVVKDLIDGRRREGEFAAGRGAA